MTDGKISEGKLEKKEEGLTSTKKPYFKMTISGKIYNCFDPPLASGVRIGDNVTFSYMEKVSGDRTFKNLTNIQPLDREPVVGTVETTNKTVKPIAKQVDKMDVRLKSFEYAKDILINHTQCKIIEKFGREELVALSEEIADYITNGRKED